jgi:hypothetical protein
MRVLGLLFCLAGMAALTAPPVTADTVSVDWNKCFALQEINLHNPRVLASINPQPEPPAPSLPALILSNPANPLIQRSTDGEADFRLLFSLSGLESLIFQAVGAPDNSGHYDFNALNELEQIVYQVVMDITTSHGGIPVPETWTQINPQPEPPLPAGAAYLGFDFTFTSQSMATLSFQVLDNQGQALSFSQVPAPASLLLLGAGLIPLLGRTRNR